MSSPARASEETLQEFQNGGDVPDTAEDLDIRRESDHDEHSKLLVQDLIKIEDSSWQLVGYCPAVYRPYREQIAEEKNMHFVPSTTQVPISDKLPEGVKQRHLADEGLYVGKPFNVDSKNRNVMEHRLIKNKELSWFGEDGEILALPDFVDVCPVRPFINDLDEFPIKPHFRKAEVVNYGDGTEDFTSSSDSRNYQLDISIGQLSFSHHPLFSHEHVLASKLMSLYKQYCRQRETSSIDFMTKKLEVLRSAVASVKESSYRSPAKGEDVNESGRSRLNRLQMYRKEIRILRQNLDQEHLQNRTVLKNIIRTWRSIKQLRQNQNYVNTPVQIRIMRKEVDVKADKKCWQEEIDGEVQDEKEDYELHHQKALEEYKQELKRYKRSKQKKKKQTARKGQEEIALLDGESHSTEPGGGHSEVPDSEGDVDGAVSKPEIPPSFDESSVREKVQQKALQTRRHPGEPILYLELSSTASVTAANQCPKAEQKRRNQVSKCKIFLKIFYNNKEVTRTNSKPLNQDFTVTFSEKFNLHVCHSPRCITLQQYQSHALSTDLLSEIYMPIPSTVDDNRHKLEEFEFSSDQVVAQSHEAVGSGIKFVLGKGYLDDDNSEVVLLTSGLIQCKVSWGLDPNGSPLAPITKERNLPISVMDPIGSLGAASCTDLMKLKNWIESLSLDPNDPSNALLIRYLNDGALSQFRREFFRLEPLQEEFNFVRSDEFFKSRRFRLLQYRNQGILEFKTLRMVPMNDKEISSDIFKTYEKRVKEEQLPSTIDDDVESYQQKVSRHLNKMKEEVWRHHQEAKHMKELSDVVSEDPIPDIGSLGMSLIKLTEKKRPLRPIRKERKRITAQNVGGAPVSILVNVASAFRVPLRKESDRSSRLEIGRQPTAANLQIMEEPLVRPVVEVTFQRTTLGTSTSSGPNPCWNQDLKFEFRCPNDDFSPSNLQTVKDTLYFNLFDEVVVDLLEDERDRGSLIHQRIEKRWLGMLRIPFSTIYLNTRIEGTFKLDSQPFLLGYTRDVETRQSHILGITSESQPLEKENTYLSVFVTLEPTLPMPEPWKDKFESYESDKLLQRANIFKSTFLEKFPKRDVRTTVIDVNAKLVFITRFLKPVAPPEHIYDEQSSSGDQTDFIRVARFVSLIPVISDIVVFPGITDIWTTNDQFLNILVGDKEEHAVLLCNYFLFMKKKAWLLLGFAIPEGRTVYVLTEENLDFRMWNACTGESFSVQDTFGPVQSIGCIINQDNIWLNIQQCFEPWRMSFNLHNSKHWRPFFDANFSNPGLTSIQPDKILYNKTDASFVEKLREKIERALRNGVMEWRKRFRTSWNRHSSQVLQKLLQKMETIKFGVVKEDEIHSELQTITSAYKMCGFALSFPYTEISAILDAVHATGVHLTEGPQLEFALAVHIHPYPHYVVAVWIYVASLQRR